MTTKTDSPSEVKATTPLTREQFESLMTLDNEAFLFFLTTLNDMRNKYHGSERMVMESRKVSS